MPLLYWGPPPDVPTLTMEAYQKWYEMFLVKPDGGVKKVEFDALLDTAICESTESPWHDHAPNPEVVRKLCESRGWWFHELAEEVMKSRF